MLWTQNKFFVSVDVRACKQRSINPSLNQFIIVSHVMLHKEVVGISMSYRLCSGLFHGENFGICLWCLVFCYVRVPVLYNQTFLLEILFTISELFIYTPKKIQ